jgi:hypothetical protein
MSAAQTWEVMLAGFLPAFTSPSFAVFIRMAEGWALCPVQRTITRIYQFAEPHGEKAHDAYHRFFREGASSTAVLWRRLAETLVAALCPQGKIMMDLDDILFHKSGRKVEGGAWWGDAVRSTGQKVVPGFGLNLALLTLRIEPPWGGEPLGLPINLRLPRKGGPSLLELAEDMVREIVSWFPQRRFHLCAYGFFAPLASAELPRIHLTSWMRRDAALYELPPPRRKGQRGRTRKKGKRLSTPEQMAQAKTGWRRVMVCERGKNKERLLLVREVMWFKVLPRKLVRLVIVRDPQGKQKDDFFFTSDPEGAPEKIGANYASPWSIEDTFKNVKQDLGGQDPQTWKEQGPERAAAFAFSLYSLIWLFYLKTNPCRPVWTPRPWYIHKSNPSFKDALAALRRVLWRDKMFSSPENKALAPEITGPLIEALANAA